VIAEVTGTGRKRGIAEIIDYHSGAEIACAFVAQNQRVEAADAARIPMKCAVDLVYTGRLLRPPGYYAIAP
jgi:hypothetical protein